MEKYEKIAEKVTGAYQKIEDSVVEGYNKVESAVVEGYKKIEDAFIDRYLAKFGETLDEAKERIKREQEELHKK